MFPVEFKEKIKSEFGTFAIQLCEYLDLIAKFRGFEICNLKSYKTVLKMIASSEGKDLKNFDDQEIVNFYDYWIEKYTIELEGVLKRDSDDYKISEDYLEKWIAAKIPYQWNSLPIIFKSMLAEKLHEDLDDLSTELNDKLDKGKK